MTFQAVYSRTPAMTNDTRQNMEEMLAHQQRQIDDLSDIVTRQWQEIEALKKRLARLQDKVVTLEESGGGEDGKSLSVTEQALRDKPPHY